MLTEIQRALVSGVHWTRAASLAWAAGLLEGDGSICGSGTATRIQVGMTDADSVERFADVVGGTVSGPFRCAGRRKPQWRASLSGIEKLMDLYVEIEPFLLSRRRGRYQDALLGADAEGRISSWEPERWRWYPWAAGLFEAEGCISYGTGPTMNVSSSDRDVIERIARVLNGPVYGPYNQRVTELGQPRRAQYRWAVSGTNRCVQVASVLRPWLGSRRRRRLDEVLVEQKFRKRPGQRCFLAEQLWD